jgi:hypothetical protein
MFTTRLRRIGPASRVFLFHPKLIFKLTGQDERELLLEDIAPGAYPDNQIRR